MSRVVHFIGCNHNFIIIQEVILFIVALLPAKPGSVLRNSWLKTPHKWLNSTAIFILIVRDNLEKKIS